MGASKGPCIEAYAACAPGAICHDNVCALALYSSGWFRVRDRPGHYVVCCSNPDQSKGTSTEMTNVEAVEVSDIVYAR